VGLAAARARPAWPPSAADRAGSGGTKGAPIEVEVAATSATAIVTSALAQGADDLADPASLLRDDQGDGTGRSAGAASGHRVADPVALLRSVLDDASSDRKE
jgi:hypothetical protein